MINVEVLITRVGGVYFLTVDFRRRDSSGIDRQVLKRYEDELSRQLNDGSYTQLEDAEGLARTLFIQFIKPQYEDAKLNVIEK